MRTTQQNREHNRRRSRKGYFTSHRYKVTLEEAQALLDVKACQICGVPKGFTKAGRSDLHIDHDHQTGKVRGVICVRCNHMIGTLEYDPERRRLCEAYLSAYRGH